MTIADSWDCKNMRPIHGFRMSTKMATANQGLLSHRHLDRANVGFSDGHVEAATPYTMLDIMDKSDDYTRTADFTRYYYVFEDTSSCLTINRP